LAIKQGDAETVALFMEHGASTANAMLVAAQQHGADIIHLFLTSPVINLNEANCIGATALINLAGAGSTADGSALLLAGQPRADVNQRTADGDTPLLYAVKRENEALFTALLARPEVNTGPTFRRQCWRRC
jgi:ankyrin repeat protein